jgi:group I intron endonuclease
MNKNCGIYKITSPTGKIYIGQSENIKMRWYKYSKLHCKRQTTLYNSFLKHGVENHQFDIIEYCTPDELNCSERFWQDIFEVIKSSGLNGVLTVCGEKRYVASEDTRKRISESLQGDKHPLYGKVGALSPSFGKKASDETRKRQSESRKGKKSYVRTSEIRKNLSEARKNDKNPMYGRTGCNHPQSKVVLCLKNGIYYDSLKDGCLAMNLNYTYTGYTVRKNKSEYFIYI